MTKSFGVIRRIEVFVPIENIMAVMYPTRIAHAVHAKTFAAQKCNSHQPTLFPSEVLHVLVSCTSVKVA